MLTTSLAELARRPLFEPFSPWLSRMSGDRPLSAPALNALLPATGVASGSGLPIRFVDAGPDTLPYEERIFLDGAVPTRQDNWHDFFNALAWLAFPHAKAAINARHHQALIAARARSDTRRGAVRDGLTQLDESGAVVCTSAPVLAELLRQHCWEELFWSRRAQVRQQMRFLLIGHAALEKLLQPYEGLCAKTVILIVPESLLRPAATTTLMAYADGALARLMRDQGMPESPRDLGNLPLLGVPGVIRASENQAYYHNAKYFRPLRSE